MVGGEAQLIFGPEPKGATSSPHAAQFHCKYYSIYQHIPSVRHKKNNIKSNRNKRKYKMKPEAAFRVM